MEDTIAAISTSTGVGAISIIRISGDESIKIVSEIFSNKSFFNAPSHTIHYGYIVDKEEKVDEVLVTLMRSPKTFTKEDIVEINAHGGVASTNKILELLLTKGCRLASPGEFTKRAFLNGRIDYIEAEGIMDLINSKTDIARKIALNRVSGKSSNLIKKLRESLGMILANIEVNLNYPEYEDIENITIEKINEMMEEIETSIIKIEKESKNGKLVQNGIKTAIIGKPNVGKSSLLNNLTGEETAIVTNIKGTTRDSVESVVVLDNLTLNLIDTAGIRKTEDLVEKKGVEKSYRHLEDADLILFMIDNSLSLSDEDFEIIDLIKNKNYITVINKCDLPSKIDENRLKNIVRISALKNKNIDKLTNKIKEMFNLDKIETTDLTYLTSARELALLNKIKISLKDVREGIKSGYTLDMIDIDLKNIWNLLGEITGDTYSDELIDQMFSNFCVGK